MRSSEAAAIADVLFQSVEVLTGSGRKLTDEARHRFAARLRNVDTPSVRVYPLSLEQDPIHPSSYYLAVDGLSHGAVTPLLLRVGLASSPASGLFPKSVLIGRMRPAGGREVVVNAIPFGPTDEQPLETFNEQVTKSFQPRPQGLQPALIVTTSTPAAMFEAFRQIYRDTGQNRAAFAVDLAQGRPGYFATVCAAIRAGWRDGYSLGLTGIPAQPGESLDGLTGYSRFSVRVPAPDDLASAATVFDRLRRLKPRGFDFELDFRGATLTAASLATLLPDWRAAGRPVNSVVLPAGGDFEELATVLRQHNALPTVEGAIRSRAHRWQQEPTPEALAELARD